MKTSDPKEITKALEGKLKEIAESQIFVGIPKEATQQKDGETFYLADIATINNFGSKSKNIPARPFGTTLMAKYGKQISDFYKKEIAEALKGKRTVKAALNRIGFVASGFMKQNLSTGKWKPNAPITIHGGWMRRGGKSFYIKGKKSAKPLIDIGQMRQSITWVIKRFKNGKNVK